MTAGGKEPIDELIERQLREPDVVFKEKIERFEKAAALKEPDRVPLFLVTSGAVLAKWYKLSELYFNYELIRKGVAKYVETFPCDVFSAMLHATAHVFLFLFPEYPEIAVSSRYITGPIHDILKDRYTRWPGREIPHDNVPFQFIGGKFMEVEEYSKLIEDPPNYIAEVVFPRVCPAIGKPGTAKYISTLAKWGAAIREYVGTLIVIGGDLRSRGTASLGPLTVAYAPLDIIADFLRHPTNAMVDLRRYPDKVRQATEVLTDLQIKIVAANAEIIRARWCFIPLHLNEMLSPKLYNEFYWPGLKKTIVELYNRGIRSFVFFEGDHTPHLETILELPKGWGIAYFEKTDVRKAKKLLEGHTCVMGGIPSSLIVGGTPDKIEEYIKNLMEEVAPGGGFIASLNVSEIPAEAPDENLRAMTNAILKYGTPRR
uniref:Uroporphyrinogen decarboxylase (URO-D) domain-containing protein n=1 Tax=Ignisphaera aggregans TaxID=334771 RepID=A0A7C2VDT6_9CREN